MPWVIRHRSIVSMPLQVVMAAGGPTTPPRGQRALTHVWIGHHAAEPCGLSRGSVSDIRPPQPARPCVPHTRRSSRTELPDGAGTSAARDMACRCLSASMAIPRHGTRATNTSSRSHVGTEAICGLLGNIGLLDATDSVAGCYSRWDSSPQSPP